MMVAVFGAKANSALLDLNHHAMFHGWSQENRVHRLPESE
jgi:hypothetical protein